MNKLELQKTANEIRKGIVSGVHAAKAGHPGGSLSAADIFTYLYFEEMNVDPKNPKDPDRDRFVLSKGHTAPGLYAALAEKGYFPKEDLLTLVKAGMQARACGNQEAREFIIVTRDDLVKAISHNSLVAGPARKASAAIVIVGKKENISFPEEWSFDCAAAAENILIEAEHLGLGSIWLQVYPYADRKAHLLNILDIPAEMEPFCIIAIGYAERKPVRMNRYNERIIYNDLYGSRKK